MTDTRQPDPDLTQPIPRTTEPTREEIADAILKAQARVGNWPGEHDYAALPEGLQVFYLAQVDAIRALYRPVRDRIAEVADERDAARKELTIARLQEHSDVRTIQDLRAQLAARTRELEALREQLAYSDRRYDALARGWTLGNAGWDFTEDGVLSLCRERDAATRELEAARKALREGLHSIEEYVRPPRALAPTKEPGDGV